MSIETCKAYRVGDKTFSSLAGAQKHQLAIIISGAVDAASTAIAESVLNHKADIIAILSLDDNEKKLRKPRSDKGQPRKPEPEQPGKAPASQGINIGSSGKYTSSVFQ